MPVRKAAIAVHEGVQALDIAGPVDVFSEANAFVAPQNGYETALAGDGVRLEPVRRYRRPRTVRCTGRVAPDRSRLEHTETHRWCRRSTSTC